MDEKTTNAYFAGLPMTPFVVVFAGWTRPRTSHVLQSGEEYWCNLCPLRNLKTSETTKISCSTIMFPPAMCIYMWNYPKYTIAHSSYGHLQIPYSTTNTAGGTTLRSHPSIIFEYWFTSLQWYKMGCSGSRFKQLLQLSPSGSYSIDFHLLKWISFQKK